VLLEATKYLVVDDNIGVVNVVPVAKAVPVTDESANHSSVVLAGGVALNVTVPEPQFALLTTAPTAVGNALYIAVTAVRVSDIQPVEVFLAAA
jgi:hypothetical protein